MKIQWTKIKRMGWLFALVFLLLIWMSTYTVRETEQVLVTQFGEIVGSSHRTPGLHFRWPFVDEVHSFEKRWLEWDGSPNQIPTRDKKYIWVDAYARWRISDPTRFYKRLRDEEGAQSRLDDIIDGEIRNVIANHDLNEIVRSTSRDFQKTEESGEEQSDNMNLSIQAGRDKLMEIVLKKSSAVMPEYGIELADVQIKRLNYVESVQQKVFERMISERKRIAERYRSEGQGRSAEIMGRIDKELKTIQSEAYRQASEIRGKSDAEAARIYAEAYNKNPEFYKFTKTLDSYRTLIDGNTEIVLSTDSDILQLMKKGN